MPFNKQRLRNSLRRGGPKPARNLLPNANPLGIITSHAVETRLGDEFDVFCNS